MKQIINLYPSQNKTQRYLGKYLFIILFMTVTNFAWGQWQDTKNVTQNPSGISPLLASTFLGGSNTDDDYEPSIAIGQNGNIFISGYTHSADFPTTMGAFNTNYNGGSTDRFVCRFDSSLENLLASTFIGGSANEYGMGLQVTNDGYVYLAGYTNSPDFPVTSGSYDETYNGGRDAFILKLDGDLTTLIASTFIGGGSDEGYQWLRIDMVVDSNSNVYAAGITKSPNFPFTSGAFDSTYAGGSVGGDAFVVKLDSNLTTLLGSTYLGGNMDEWRVSIALDKTRNIYVCGETSSSNFPTSQNAYDPGFNGGSDIFISRFTNNLTALSSSTFLGANSYEEALAIRLNNSGNVYVAGYTMSPTFPTTPGVYDMDYNGGERDAYIAKFDSCLTLLLASTFIGGNSKDTGEDIAIDENGNVYLAGVTLSANFPTTTGAYDENYNGGEDIFISKMDSNLTALTASTFVGSSGHEKGQGIALDEEMNIYITGQSTSPNFPCTPNTYDPNYNGGGNDCFVIKFDKQLSFVPTSIEDKNPNPGKSEYFDMQPNPFRQSLKIKYSLTERTKVTLQIYNMQGQELNTLVNRFQNSGRKTVTWYGSDSNGNQIGPGIYFCTFVAGNNKVTQKIVKH